MPLTRPLGDAYMVQAASSRGLIEVYDREGVMRLRTGRLALDNHPGYRAVRAVDGVGPRPGRRLGRRDRQRDPVHPPDRPPGTADDRPPTILSWGAAEKGLSVSSEFRVVIVDDDEFKRGGIRARLDATPEVAVVADVDPDIAFRWPEDRWRDVDAVLVDIFDDRGVGEVGTDLYSGIKVVEKVRQIKDLRCIAVTTSCAHPLVQLRLYQAEPDYCYHRFDLMDLEAVLAAVRFPERGQKLPPPDPWTIKSLGARNLKANDVVRTYEDSALHGRLDAQAGIKELDALGVERRAIEQFRLDVVALGFNRLEAVPPSSRWPVVRTLVLRLLGRQDGPWSEHDKPW